MALSIFAAYLIFCILVGICGSQRRLGFLGAFFLSIFFTPVLTLIGLMLTGPAPVDKTVLPARSAGRPVFPPK